ncbi:hypothetical protein [Actinomadura rudentiformis]|uniref:Uncharacterized protein n=1 Tax=Actinomadura rudentiformis TaxID=359158 RepID=A0A6H9YUC8_9ACTN|nr:hypothetical protein [Actinomadura rudentiformis]KAB2344898.1 hypothetical protein F8566_30375 [Actinomadura rudentiformis]
MPTSDPQQPTQAQPPKCWCLFDHPLTEEARALVKRQLDYARNVQDPQGMLIHLIRLTGDCPARRSQATILDTRSADEPSGDGGEGVAR